MSEPTVSGDFEPWSDLSEDQWKMVLLSQSTSHVYGCEQAGCSQVATLVQVWRPGFGYKSHYYCPALSGSSEQVTEQ